jgi:CrcB protein
MIYLWIFVGSAIGGMARYWVSGAVARRIGETFPWGTVIINISGSFLIAFFGAVAIQHGSFPVPADVRTFLMVGFCGGYTTVSSFALQTLNLARDSEWLWATANVIGSIVLCVAAAWLGFGAGTVITHAGSG